MSAVLRSVGRDGRLRVSVTPSHDWRRLATEGGIQHIRCALCRVRMTSPVDGPLPGFLCPVGDRVTTSVTTHPTDESPNSD